MISHEKVLAQKRPKIKFSLCAKTTRQAIVIFPQPWILAFMLQMPFLPQMSEVEKIYATCPGISVGVCIHTCVEVLVQVICEYISVKSG